MKKYIIIVSIALFGLISYSGTNDTETKKETTYTIEQLKGKTWVYITEFEDIYIQFSDSTIAVRHIFRENSTPLYFRGSSEYGEPLMTKNYFYLDSYGDGLERIKTATCQFHNCDTFFSLEDVSKDGEKPIKCGFEHNKVGKISSGEYIVINDFFHKIYPSSNGNIQEEKKDRAPVLKIIELTDDILFLESVDGFANPPFGHTLKKTDKYFIFKPSENNFFPDYDYYKSIGETYLNYTGIGGVKILKLKDGKYIPDDGELDKDLYIK